MKFFVCKIINNKTILFFVMSKVMKNYVVICIFAKFLTKIKIIYGNKKLGFELFIFKMFMIKSRRFVYA